MVVSLSRTKYSDAVTPRLPRAVSAGHDCAWLCTRPCRNHSKPEAYRPSLRYPASQRPREGDTVSDGHDAGERPPGYRLMLREMAPDERPRERLKLRGSSALSDGDLLAIILNTGIRGETVTDVSQRLLAQHGGLRGLFRMDLVELSRIRGLGDAKAVRLKAALELGRRLAALSPDERPPVGSPEDVANLLQIEMAALEQEQLRVVLLDTKHRIMGSRTVYQGSVNQKR